MASSPPPLPEDVLEALRRGRKIDAIKLLRQHLGGGLKEAKAAVESRGRVAAPVPGRASDSAASRAATGLSPGEVPRSRSFGWVVVVLVLLGYVAVRLVRG